VGVPRRFAATATVVAAVVVFAGVLYVFVKKDPVPHAGSTPGFTAQNLGSPSPSGSHGVLGVSTSLASASSTPTSSSSAVQIVFLGDDYTAAVGAPGHGFTGAVANQLGAHKLTVASPGAGYAKPGTDHHAYLDLEQQVVADHPDVVVVSGGRNDIGDDPATLRDDAKQLFARLHHDLPDATLVAVAPWWGDSAHPADLKPVDDAVRTGVQAAGGTYLDLADPLAGHPSWMATDADPNARGYQAIATSLVAALQPLLPSP